MSFEGVVENIVFRNPENGFCVIRLRSGTELLTAVGNMPPVRPGESVKLSGVWEEDRRFGRQFRAEHCEVQAPTSRQGLLAYLSSGLVRGIGPEFARRIVAAFGADTLKVLDEQPERLLEVNGIGPKRAREIQKAWENQRAAKDTMIFLQGHGISAALAARIHHALGKRAIELVCENPYRLADEVFGIGFRTADRIASALGIGPDSPQRSQAAVLYLLGRAADEGHVFCPRAELKQRAQQEIGLKEESADAAVEELERTGQLAVESGPQEAVYLRGLYQCETEAARRLAALAGARVAAHWKQEWLLRFEERHGLRLAPHQRDAVEKAFRRPLLIITGGPGTGKTTIVRAITSIGAGQRLRVALCAPTGRAAKRLSEATGREAHTIHRLLEYDPVNRRFTRDAARPLDADMLVVDEMSMVDLPLFAHLLAALPGGCSLVLVGDADQLPSVGPGCVLREAIQWGGAPVVALEEIFRQAHQSRIVINAHRILHGRMPDVRAEENGDFFFLPRERPEDILETVKQLVAERLPRHYGFHPRDDIQVMAPMHRGLLGVGNLNRQLQSLLNPSTPPEGFHPGDKVMQLRNNYDLDVFNGDIGRVERRQAETLVVNFEGRRVAYHLAELHQLTLAYACSIHKAQGSEYPAVVVPLHTQHYLMLQRNLLYTAVTRGRRLVVLVGSPRALELAVRNCRQQRRYSRLQERLRENRPGDA